MILDVKRKDWPTSTHPLEKQWQQLLETVNNDQFEKDSKHPFTIIYQYYSEKKMNQAVENYEIETWLNFKA